MKLLAGIKQRIYNYKRRLSEKMLPKASEIEKKRIEKIRLEIKELLNNKVVATDYWAKKRSELYEAVTHNDPRNFTNWPVMYPMFYVADELEFNSLKKRNNWNELSKLLAEDKIGNPAPYKQFPKSSGNLLHHAYSLFEYLDHSGKKLEATNTIFEFGGGYGSFCRLCYRNGFKGTYIIFDLPEYSAFQDYFLSSLDLNLKIYRNKLSTEANSVCLINDLSVLDTTIHADLFIALWSLSECPLELREKLKPIFTKSPSLLIGFQEKFEVIDNVQYFNNQFNAASGASISAIKHMPGNFYLLK